MTFPFGYMLHPPGPHDWGRTIDRPPTPVEGEDYGVAHNRWRSSVEQELSQRLLAGEISIWYPLAIPKTQPILPLIGGEPPTDWRESVGVMIEQAMSAGHRTVRVIDLSRHALWRDLYQDLQGSGLSDVLLMAGSLDPGQTSSGLLAGLTVGGASELIADVLRADSSRSGRNDAARQMSILTTVASFLSREPSFTLLADAAKYALTLDDSGVTLLPAEMQALDNYHARHVQNRTSLARDLDDLEQLLAVLASFDRVRQPLKHGRSVSGSAISLRGIAPLAGGVSHELAADLLSARLAREMAHLDKRRDVLTIVLGADEVAEPILKSIMAVSLQNRSRLVLFFERFVDQALDVVGSAGASVGGFFRLANNREAEAAADFMGRQHKFELTGLSASDSTSFEWGWSTSVGTDASTSRSMQTGRMFSANVTSSFSRSRNEGQSGGGGTSHTSGRDYSRVYEYILEPASFQALPAASLMMVDVGSKSSAMVSCSRDVHQSHVTSKKYVLELGA